MVDDSVLFLSKVLYSNSKAPEQYHQSGWLTLKQKVFWMVLDMYRLMLPKFISFILLKSAEK